MLRLWFGCDGLPARLRRRVRRADQTDRRRPHRTLTGRIPRRGGPGSTADLTTFCRALAGRHRREHEAGSANCAPVESAARAAEQAELDDDRNPLQPDAV